jgi:hypothetical protein
MYYIEMHKKSDNSNEYMLKVELMMNFEDLLKEQQKLTSHPENNIDAFIREMTALSLKYNIWVGGCDGGAYLATGGTKNNDLMYFTGHYHMDGGFEWKDDHYEADLRSETDKSKWWS